MPSQSRLLIIIPVLFCLAATWNERDDATGTWHGLRSRLAEEYGLHLDVDYTAETFVSEGNRGLSYHGNVDLVLTINTQKLRLWDKGTFFVYAACAWWRCLGKIGIDHACK